ncbi:MAG: hypothetical protein JWM27_1501 [Gemmatimonadetes bacterium]|nr:hypothetical protein [Gemmatimonadota bacterium]
MHARPRRPSRLPAPPSPVTALRAGFRTLPRAALLACALAACSGRPDAARRKDAASAAAPGAPSDSARKPGPPRTPRPDSLRALYVNGWAAGSHARMAELLRIADSTEVNAFVVDVKESDTYLSYARTEIPLAKEIGADQRPASRWFPALLDTLRAHHVYPIARIVVFKDRMLAERRPEMAIRHVNGGVWKDQKGKPWVNPYDRRVWNYNVAIAREALEMGFQEVQWDYVRFPDVVPALQRTMAFPGAGATTKADNIHDFIAYSKQQLAPYGAPITADVFGLSTHLEGDVGIGQNWEKIVSVADAVQPMVYPSHYFAGMYGFQQPNQHPFEFVRLAMEDAAVRTRWVRESGRRTGEVIPWLQAFSAPWLDDFTYGPVQLRQQIQATYDAGLKSWILWNPGSRYDIYLPALRPASGAPSALERGGWKPPRWPVPRNRLSLMIRHRESPAKATGPATDSAHPSAAPPRRPAQAPTSALRKP